MSNEAFKYLPLPQRTEAELIRELTQLEWTIRQLSDGLRMRSYPELLELSLSLRAAQLIQAELDSRTLSASI